MKLVSAGKPLKLVFAPKNKIAALAVCSSKYVMCPITPLPKTARPTSDSIDGYSALNGVAWVACTR